MDVPCMPVCSICLQINSRDDQLIQAYCRYPEHHQGMAAEVMATWSWKRQELVRIRPFPGANITGKKYIMCDRVPVCFHGEQCTYAHSEEEMMIWNMLLEDKRRHPTDNMQRVNDSFYSNYKERSKNPPSIQDAMVNLTPQTYVSKFCSLLYFEEVEHMKILSERCDGDYEIEVYPRKDIPPWVRKDYGNLSSRYGCISGMSGDQIMYASQASECLFIVDQGVKVCAAKILEENMHEHYDAMMIEFTDKEAGKLEEHYKLGTGPGHEKVKIDFEVKHLYFDLLHKSLKSLSTPAQISKVVPTSGGHVNVLPVSKSFQPQVSYEFLKLDEQSQLPALEKVVSSSAQYPVLVSGAFGTGKTRLLAVATYHFIEEGKQRNAPTRVLLCCHHQKTADAFIEEYFGKMVQHRTHPWKVKLARLTRFHYTTKTNYHHLYIDNNKFRKNFFQEYANESCVVVVTTFLTALSVKMAIRDKYFTHILLDEAAQVREPEAVAPLCMANLYTKIVVAGDNQQVGPGILVLGDVAQENGLATSFFARLMEIYDDQHQLPLVVLNTNYRCHEAILSLACSLFYSSELLPCVDHKSICIPDIHQPIWFVCSSLDKIPRSEVQTDKIEAITLIDQLKVFFKNQGQLDNHDVCIMATNRQQLSDIKQNLSSFKPPKLVPTYLIQGGEFKALFVSTVESLDPSGRSYNSTKSLCSPSVFNTVITRAKSLIVAVGNPYTLMTVEEKMGAKKRCWAEYLSRCFISSTVMARKGITNNDLQELNEFVEQALRPHACISQQLQPVTEEKQDKAGGIDEAIRNQQQEIYCLQQLVLHLEEQQENEHKRTSMDKKESDETIKKQQSVIQNLEQVVQQLKGQQVNEKEHHNKSKEELQQKIHLLQQQVQLEEKLSEEEQRHWVVKREEVNMTTKEMGCGSWGVVKVAKFRGLPVAVKCLHKTIISRYNCQLFRREMTISAKLRHPNLVLFIGATVEGEPMILTELMPTSLRKELENETFLSYKDVATISRDVSCGLTYMHLFEVPIIHRDISSGNVLLEPFRDGWRAKVADYGAANFMRLTTTMSPGSIAYAAPEAYEPTQHTPKMDVYSFGVLLVEICTGEFPDIEAQPKLITRIQWQPMVSLVKKCIEKNRLNRPDMSDIMSQLDTLLNSM